MVGPVVETKPSEISHLRNLATLKLVGKKVTKSDKTVKKKSQTCEKKGVRKDTEKRHKNVNLSGKR